MLPLHQCWLEEWIIGLTMHRLEIPYSLASSLLLFISVSACMCWATHWTGTHSPVSPSSMIHQLRHLWFHFAFLADCKIHAGCWWKYICLKARTGEFKNWDPDFAVYKGLLFQALQGSQNRHPQSVILSCLSSLPTGSVTSPFINQCHI